MIRGQRAVFFGEKDITMDAAFWQRVFRQQTHASLTDDTTLVLNFTQNSKHAAAEMTSTPKNEGNWREPDLLDGFPAPDRGVQRPAPARKSATSGCMPKPLACAVEGHLKT